MDDLDKNLLNILQTEFPLSTTPFAELGAILGIEESEVICRIKRLKDDLIIRNIGPIFDSRGLGYTSTLVALKVPADKLESSAAIVSEHKSVSHNYARDDEYNLWFTLTTPPGTELKSELTQLMEKVDPDEYLDLPALQTFKLNVLFNVGSQCTADKKESKVKLPKKNSPLTNIAKLIINDAQKDLSLVSRPFDNVANKIGIDVNELISSLQSLKDSGILRRFGASLKHRNDGFNANALVCWRVPFSRINEAGRAMAEFSEVSHCYERKIYLNWPYNIFTMIHAKTQDGCIKTAANIAQITRLTEYKTLFSIKEFKKVRVQYQL